MFTKRFLTNTIAKKVRAQSVLHQSGTFGQCTVNPLRYQSRDTSKRYVAIMAEEDKPQGHSVSKNSAVSEENTDPEIVAYQEYMKNVSKPTHAEEGRTLVELGKYGVINTIKSTEPKGYPFGAVVQYVADGSGRPIFCISKLADHTQDLMKDSRASLTIQCEGFSGLTDARITITGDVTPVPDGELAEVKEIFLEGHPKAFWVTFGDFNMYRMDRVQTARYVGGFGRIGTISEADYAAATPDPVQAFSGPICTHMNDDHADSLLTCMKGIVGLRVDSAKMQRVDKLGMDLLVTRDEQQFKSRIAWPEPAMDRKAVKDQVIALLQQARAKTGETKEA